uniref:Uncharacterized protein n=1 Tax=Salmo trutta TaxID=8032 RepID=A0A673W8H4_SALTR
MFTWLRMCSHLLTSVTVGGNVIISIVYLSRHRCNLNMHTLNTQDSEPPCITLKQLLRKLVLEIIHRIPTDEHLIFFASHIVCFQIAGEDNVLIYLHIIIELHKHFRPQISQEARYFENPQVIAENIVPSPEMVGMITSVLVSIPVLAELPIIVVLMYQMYKLKINNLVSEIVPLVMNTMMGRQRKLYNRELYSDFTPARIKTLSFLACSISIYQDLVGKYSQQMVKGMLQLLTGCPSETAHLHKELLIAAKHILTKDLRNPWPTARWQTTSVSVSWLFSEQENDNGLDILIRRLLISNDRWEGTS